MATDNRRLSDWGYGMQGQTSTLPSASGGASGTQDWINQQPFRQQAGTPYEFNKFQSQVTTENGQWMVSLNVRFFEPEDLRIKTVGDQVEINAKHNEKQDAEGSVCREFTRKYHLPEGVDPLDVKCDLTADGILLISAPLPYEKDNTPGETIKMKVRKN